MKLAWRGVRTGLVLALCAVCGTAGAVQDSSTSVMAPPTHAHGAIAFVRAPVVVAGEWVGRFPQGSKLMTMEVGTAASSAPVELTPEFFAVGDPAISFDGMRVLFSGQVRRGERWQIWEMPVAGGAERQVTRCAGDCLKAVYLAGDQIAFTALNAGRESEIFVSALSGAGAHAITFGPGRFEVETALRSGRLLVSAAGIGGIGRRLFVVDPDGSGWMLLRRDGGRGVSGGAVEMADGTVVFLERGVGLGWVRPGALQAAVMERGAYASVAAMGEGLVVSRGGDLYRMELKRGGREALVYRGTHGVSVDAVEIATRAAVLAYPSILHLERTTGRILCLDAYATEDVASGRLAAKVARVRVVAKEPRGERVLGEAPVEMDGSFYATVPADTPIRVELVGAKGEVVKAQRSWMWVRGGEDRGCPGCHESQALAAENRSPMALQRLDTPSVLVAEKLKAVRP